MPFLRDRFGASRLAMTASFAMVEGAFVGEALRVPRSGRLFEVGLRDGRAALLRVLA